MASDEPADVTRTLDAREIEGEPFDAIMSALADLPADGTLELVNSFEPEPLYGVLAERGYAHETERVADDEYRVYVSREE